MMGPPMGSTSERTAVTGAPTLSPPRHGQVLGERYEVRHRLGADPFSIGLLAFDQETEESVLLRVLRPELLDPDQAADVTRRLQHAVGVGGKYLPALLDADRDGLWVYTTETLPEGVSMRDVLDGRIATPTRSSAEELLPLVAHLDAALAVIPAELWHGDVRPAQIWIDTHRLELKGPFLVPALPSGALAAVLRRHGDLRRRGAPELMAGRGGPASDRYAVAALVHEALTLTPPPEPGAAVSPALGPLARPLGALLHPDPNRRSASLEPLIEALARVAGLAPPDLEPAPARHRQRLRPRPLGARPLASTEPPADTIAAMASETDPSAPDSNPTVVGPSPSAEERTVVVGAVGEHEPTAVRPPPSGSRSTDLDATAVGPAPATPASLDDELLATAKMNALGADEAAAILTRTRAQTGDSSEERVPSDPAIPAAPRKESSLDPRLARMARAADRARPRPRRFPSDPGLPAEEGDEESSLDPRLVRAALGLREEESEPEVPRDPSVPATAKKDGTQELALEELDFVPEEEAGGVPLDPSVPAEARPDGTQELALEELEDLHPPPARETHGTDQISLEDLEQMAAEHRRAAVPEGLKPVPRPRRDSGLNLTAATPLFDDSSGPHAARAQPEIPDGIGVPVVAQAATMPAAAAHPPTAARGRRRRGVGLTVVIVAMVLGLAIIVGSFLYARHKQAQADELRRQRLQERFQQLRGGE